MVDWRKQKKLDEKGKKSNVIIWLIIGIIIIISFFIYAWISMQKSMKEGRLIFTRDNMVRVKEAIKMYAVCLRKRLASGSK